MYTSLDKRGYTQVDHTTFDLILPTLSPSAQLVFLRIYRQTVGWKKPIDKISLSQFRKMTGYKDNKTIISGIDELEERNLIIVVREDTKTNSYSLDIAGILACGNNP